jgi:hypothetical protein
MWKKNEGLWKNLPSGESDSLKLDDFKALRNQEDLRIAALILSFTFFVCLSC